MGVHLGRVKDVDIRTLNELFLLTQPAHLQKLSGRKLEGDIRRAADQPDQSLDLVNYERHQVRLKFGYGF